MLTSGGGGPGIRAMNVVDVGRSPLGVRHGDLWYDSCTIHSDSRGVSTWSLGLKGTLGFSL